MAQISSNLDCCCRRQPLKGAIQLSSNEVKIKHGEGGGGDDNNINHEDDDDDDSSIIQREFVYQLAFFFYSLSGSSLNSDNNAVAAAAIDPTDFFQYLSSNYNAAAAAINTDDVGDAVTVFRSLISMLEHSVQKEVQRLCKVVGATEIQIEKNEIGHVETEEVTEVGEVEIIRLLRQQLKTALDRTQSTMHETWSGHLVSRIAGTLTTTTTSSISTFNNADDDSMAHTNTATTTTTTTTTLQQRIKKNGNIQRPLPIPLPLPVKKNGGSKNDYNNDKSSSCYFPSLVHALYNITINPNPIRGFDWSGLIKRGEVNEETNTFVEIISVEKEDEKNMEKNDYDNDKFLNAVRSENQDINKISHLPSDCLSVTTISSSQSNTCPTTDVVCDLQEAVHGNEDELHKNDMTLDNSNSFIITNDEHYAAAVMALKKANQGTTKIIRRGGDKIRHDSLMERHHGRGSRRQLSDTEGGQNEIDVATEVVLTGDDNKFIDEESSPSSRGIKMTNKTPKMKGDWLSLPAKYISSSEEDSSVDSHVSDVNTNSSDDTHSSAIETPSDIDNISLGSFTDDSVDSKEKTNSDAVSHNYVAPILCLQDEENVDKDKETMPSTTRDDSYSSGDNDDDDNSSSSNSSDNTSSTETDSSRSSSSEESSSSSYSTSSSSVGNNNAGDNVTATDNNNNGCSRDSCRQVTIHNDWITRKETRFCLPLPMSLIFHLKRFDYSTISGQVEKLSGFMDIPSVLDIRTCCSSAATAATVDSSQREASSNFRYHLSGAIVHVDPIDDDNDPATNFGELIEGHYVTFVRDWNNDDDDPRWIEIDDEFVRMVDDPSSSNSSVPTDISASSNAKEQHRYATMVIYTRECARIK